MYMVQILLVALLGVGASLPAAEARLSGARAAAAEGRAEAFSRLRRQARTDDRSTVAPCMTERCVRRAERLLDGLSPQDSPCEDFSKYACGGRFLRDSTSGAQASVAESVRKQTAINDFLKATLERCVCRAERLLDLLSPQDSPCEDFSKYACGGRFLRDSTSGAQASVAESVRKQTAINDFLKATLEQCVCRAERLLDLLSPQDSPCEDFSKYACGGRFLRDSTSGAQASVAESVRKQTAINDFLKATLERCVCRAERLLDLLSPQDSPCEDFSKYACGGRFLRDSTSGAQASVAESIRKQTAINDFHKATLAGDAESSWTRAERLAQQFYSTCYFKWYTKKHGEYLYSALARAVGADHIISRIDLDTVPQNIGAMLRALYRQFGVQLAPVVTPFRDEHGNCALLVDDGDDYNAFNENLDLATDSDILDLKSKLQPALNLAEEYTETVKEHCTGTYAIHNTTVQQLARNAPQFGWPELLGLPVNSTTLVYVQDCILKLSSALTKYEKNYPLKFKNMLIARALRRIWKKEEDDAAKQTNCLALTRQYFGSALTRMYLTKFPVDVSGAPEMLQRLRQQLQERLRRAPWLDQAVKQAYVDRIEGLNLYVGYNNISDDVARLEAHYFTLQLKDELPGDLTRVAHWRADAILRDCKSAIWESQSPLDVQGGYFMLEQSLVAPVGEFRGTEYDPAQPPVLNYAALGAELGLLLMYTLASDLRYKDIHGGEYQLSNATRSWLDRGDNCLATYYKSSVDEEAEIDSIRAYDAELHGLKLAHEAWRAGGGLADPPLPSVGELLTPDQVFYVLYAQYNCNNEESSSSSKYTSSLLSQIPEVGRLWNCPEGSALSPAASDRCELW